MYTVTIKGFDSMKAAKTFIDWFDGQGEQDAAMWFEETREDQKAPVVAYGKGAAKILNEKVEGNIDMPIKFV